MTTGHEMALREEAGLQARRPGDIVAQMTEWANALMDIVEKQKLYVVIGGNKHIEVEGWQTIGHFDQALPIAEIPQPVLEKGEVIGYMAKVNITKRGLVISSATSFCGLNESVCLDKEGRLHDKAVNACMSMAQTRATSKAYRLAYSVIAVLAGYKPTPAEEMIREKEAEHAKKTEADAPMGLCPVHKKPFRQGKQGNWYCSTKVGEGWCKEKPQPKARIVESAVLTNDSDPGEITPAAIAKAAAEVAEIAAIAIKLEEKDAPGVAELKQSTIAEEAGRRPISQGALAEINKLLVATKTGTAEIRKMLDVNSLTELTVAQGHVALETLRKKKPESKAQEDMKTLFPGS